MPLRIALSGNPNAGKTSMFNRITGALQRVGNWGGVTVEIKEGAKTIDNEKVVFVDLPGTYSLSAFSEEEKVARNYIMEQKPDVVIDVIDTTNLDRHLYLAVQLMEMGVRPVLALNMWDEVGAKGINIDIEKLKTLSGCSVVTTNARTGEGISLLTKEAVKQGKMKNVSEQSLKLPLPKEIALRIEKLADNLKRYERNDEKAFWLAMKLFEKDLEIEKTVSQFPGSTEIFNLRNVLDNEIVTLLGDESANLITESRYGYIAGLLREVVSRTRQNAVEISDTIDTVLTHKFWAYPIFIGFMWLLFQATFKLGEYPMGWIETGVGWLAQIAQFALPEGVIKELVVDGIIAGVGGIIVFLPNILILFLGISIMEDTGYMARAAFIMDRVMHKIGLHGKSFIPMIMGLGCSVPAIMAARTLESRSDRIKTILLTPLVSCSARLPVFVLFAGAFFPRHAGNVVFLFQVVLSFGAFIGMAFLFKHTLFRNAENIPFVMELPPYRVPTVRSVLIHMWQKAEHYLKKMGGVVLVFSIILWWVGSYPKSLQTEAHFNKKIETVNLIADVSQEEKEERISEIKAQMHSEIMGQTYIGKIGKFFEPIVRPFGTDWRGAISLITGFVAKEVVVSSMGVLYAAGDEQDEESGSLREKLLGQFTPLSAIAFMLFVLLYTPCIVAFVTIIRELKNWRWSLFSLGYQVVLAWSMATIVFQSGKLLGLN